MKNKLDNALQRLEEILPLRLHQSSLEEPIKRLHQQLLQSFVVNGRMLNNAEMCTFVNDVANALSVLSKTDLVVFSSDGKPIGAYPFTRQRREHLVRINGHEIYAMCALDALAISPMYGARTIINSKCRVTGEVLSIQQLDQQIENKDHCETVHLGIAWGAFNDKHCCADSLCTQIVFLKDADIAQQWLLTDSKNNQLFTLKEAIEFASRFFKPLLN